ncbi:MAG TPA: hypothetical protein VK427_05355 [Kofleriaceae bacterium]|nr:hypothetical protein [Kofleriaceae bacterium]
MMLAGCGVGSDDAGGDDAPIEPVKPNPLMISCTDAFKITGTFTPSGARPADVGGCWPAGTWTFSVALDPSDDAILDVTGDRMPDRCGKVSGTSAATFKSSYSFVVTRTDDGQGYADAYMMATGQGIAASCSQAGDCLARLKVTEGGDRECMGGLEIYGADRKQYWNLQPTQATGSTTLAGSGEFTLYQEAQVP